MIVICTDSTAYLSKQEAKELGVIYIPMTYTYDGKTFEEGHITNNDDEDDDELIRATDAHTSQPVMGSFLNRFSKLLKANCEILCLTISARLSGTYSNALVCAGELGNKGIRIIDTQTAGAGIYLLVKEARELINKGLSLHDVADSLLKLRDKIKTCFSVSDVSRLRKSGRLGSIKQSISTILNQRPIFTSKDGTAVCTDLARGAGEQIRKLAEAVPDNAQDVTVQYYKDQAAASKVALLLKEKMKREIPMRRIGPVLGIYLGPDVLSTLWREA